MKKPESTTKPPPTGPKPLDAVSHLDEIAEAAKRIRKLRQQEEKDAAKLKQTRAEIEVATAEQTRLILDQERGQMRLPFSHENAVLAYEATVGNHDVRVERGPEGWVAYAGDRLLGGASTLDGARDAALNHLRMKVKGLDPESIEWNDSTHAIARGTGAPTTKKAAKAGRTGVTATVNGKVLKLSPGRGGDFMASMDEKPVGIFANLRNGQEALLEEAGVTPDGFDDVTWTELPPADGADGARKAG